MSDEPSPAADPTPEDPAAALREEARHDPRLATALAELEQLRTLLEEERARRAEKQKKKANKKKKDKKDSLGTSRGIETMFRTSYRTHIDLSGLADNKANIMISINGLIISILLASISPKIDANPWLLIPTTVLLIGCVAAMVYAVLAARPRVSTTAVSVDDIKANRANILFFGNFVTMPQDEFVEGMRDLINDQERLYTNMIRDIYSLGNVLAKKFRLLRVSYNLFMAALVIGVPLFISVFIGVAWFGFGVPLDPGFP